MSADAKEPINTCATPLTTDPENVGNSRIFTPAMSIFVTCVSEEEIDKLFAKLSEGGKVHMPLNKYPFSRKFAWAEDGYGVSWQLNLP
jgi:predicted 3-demethylubiquinone-9 3-methyltransferase (glyoxalase superfamily)